LKISQRLSALENAANRPKIVLAPIKPVTTLEDAMQTYGDNLRRFNAGYVPLASQHPSEPEMSLEAATAYIQSMLDSFPSSTD